MSLDYYKLYKAYKEAWAKVHSQPYPEYEEWLEWLKEDRKADAAEA